MHARSSHKQIINKLYTNRKEKTILIANSALGCPCKAQKKGSRTLLTDGQQFIIKIRLVMVSASLAFETRRLAKSTHFKETQKKLRVVLILPTKDKL